MDNKKEGRNQPYIVASPAWQIVVRYFFIGFLASFGLWWMLAVLHSTLPTFIKTLVTDEGATSQASDLISTALIAAIIALVTGSLAHTFKRHRILPRAIAAFVGACAAPYLLHVFI